MSPLAQDQGARLLGQKGNHGSNFRETTTLIKERVSVVLAGLGAQLVSRSRTQSSGLRRRRKLHHKRGSHITQEGVTAAVPATRSECWQPSRDSGAPHGPSNCLEVSIEQQLRCKPSSLFVVVGPRCTIQTQTSRDPIQSAACHLPQQSTV